MRSFALSGKTSQLGIVAATKKKNAAMGKKSKSEEVGCRMA
jgi:hypothetical protein